jgi:anti-sigma B factor antagonist
MELGMNTREAGDVTILDLEGELDTYTAVRDIIVRLVDEGKKKILLNMAGVEYIDSAGLGTLVGGLKRATENDGILKIVHANEQLQKVFNITGLVRVFEQFESEEEALRSFS